MPLADGGGASKLKLLKELSGDQISITTGSQSTLTNEILTKTIEDTSEELTTISATTSKRATTSIEGGFFDITAIIQASQEISAEIVLDKLLLSIINIVNKYTDADKTFIILKENEQLIVRAEMLRGSDVAKLIADPIDSRPQQVCRAIIKNVEANSKEIILHDAMREGNFIHDEYIQTQKIHSILCIPLIHQAKLIGILYFENKEKKGAFNSEFLHVLSLLTAQMAISIENALFYSNLEVKVADRTKELKRMQSQLIQQEKMASLGLLTAGIAHEIKNPLNFVINFSELSEGLLSDIKNYFDEHQSDYTPEERQTSANAIMTIQTNIDIVKEQGMHADAIVKKMLEHSIGKAGERVPTDIRTLIEESLMISYHNVVAKNPLFQAEVKKDYDLSIEKIDISAEDISRVLVNIFDNAYFALLQQKKLVGDTFIPLINIKTNNLGKEYEIRISDNGIGIPKDIAEKIFTPFFTTRSLGEGAGLGLSLSHSIVTQQHDGSLTFVSNEGAFTEFIIKLPIKAKKVS